MKKEHFYFFEGNFEEKFSTELEVGTELELFCQLVGFGTETVQVTKKVKSKETVFDFSQGKAVEIEFDDYEVSDQDKTLSELLRSKHYSAKV